MNPKAIHTETDYQTALQRIDVLMEEDPRPESFEGKELELLVRLVERYEEEKYPIDLPNPIAAIQFPREQEKI